MTGTEPVQVHAFLTSAMAQLEWDHRRSRVEAKMNCIKQLGQRLMAKAFDRQVAEVQIRAAILNRFTTLGTPKTARVV